MIPGLLVKDIRAYLEFCSSKKHNPETILSVLEKTVDYLENGCVEFSEEEMKMVRVLLGIPDGPCVVTQY